MNYKLRALKIITFVVVGVAVLSGVVMALWNWLMPALFSGLHAIKYTQALGLLVLSKILFSGFRGRGHGGWHRHGPGGRQRWERWQKMTPEEREQFQQGMFSHRGPSKE
jgi:hypothetical protein